MKIIASFGCIFFLIIVIHCVFGIANIHSAGPVQIVVPVNHSFHLEIGELNHILEADNIKDRHVVVVSVAGALRQGKSFLLNFFLKYLYAEYEKHDITDWIGENENNSELLGFKWRGGQNHETVGILMWSDIFTHDFPNGDKVAIILLDTQGIFDRHSSVRDYTTIFALSMMLSSIQCYNLMHNIQENDLQHLQFFTEYGRLAMQTTDEKPFQYLLFIVRDWSFAYETGGYGWNGEQIIHELFNVTDDQPFEMKLLRQRIESSFQEIAAFLMPHPGFHVARQPNFTGNLQLIDPEFKQYVKELATTLLAPDNLVIKRINGRRVRARDFVTYLQAYINTFNGNSLPEPKTAWEASLQASKQIQLNECLNDYSDLMQNAFNKMESYFTTTQILQLHWISKQEVILKCKMNPSVDGDEFESRLTDEIDSKFIRSKFQNMNNVKRSNYILKSTIHNEKLSNEIQQMALLNLTQRINDLESSISMDIDLFAKNLVEATLNEFDNRKIVDGENDVSTKYRNELKQELDSAKFIGQFEFYNSSLAEYTDSMRRSIENHESYFESIDLNQLHKERRDKALDEMQTRFGCNEITTSLQRRMNNEIDKQFVDIQAFNKMKRERFIGNANSHNKNLCRTIKDTIEEGARAEISRSRPLNEYDLNGLYLGMKEVAFEMFDAGKMGNSQLAKKYRDELEQDLIDYRNVLIGYNSFRRSFY